MPDTGNDSTVDRGLLRRAGATEEVRSLLARAGEAARSAQRRSTAPGLDAAASAKLQFVANRLTRSVTRPLGVALVLMEGVAGAPAPAAANGSTGDGGPEIGEQVWRLATDATRLPLDLPAEVREAAAALQHLAIRLAPADGPEAAPARLAELRRLQADQPRRIQTVRAGPYVTTNVERLTNWLGEPVEPLPQMALCRCGASALRPFCDGAHAEIGFLDAKDPGRVPDQRDTYVGQQVTILDNRGICQHSGFCTDRLASAFHVGQEPFVTPSGGRMDEIVRAVRDCPSGALSLAIDGREARELVDHANQREPAIEVSKDGPYRITGGIPLADADEHDVTRSQGSSLEHYALCRCGHSRNKPFCSGAHWDVQFADPIPAPDHEPTIFEWCGGLPALTRMTRLFYEKHVPQDPLLAPLFSTMSADHPERVAMWLAEVFCGPALYSEKFGGYPRMVSQHIGKGLTEEKRGRWVQLIMLAALEAGLPNDAEFRSAFGAYIEWGSRLAVENSQPGCKPPENMPVPNWDWSTSAGPPGSRIKALPSGAEAEAAPPVVLPGPDDPVRFEEHVKQLFRAQDRRSMKFAFDLWAHDDVKLHAPAILQRLEAGSMPCDGRWPTEWVAVFRRWVQSGTME
jgi:CDGSH-type Zn-finger protein/truncated hemoglobin YjbI